MLSLTNPWVALLIAASLIGTYLKGHSNGFERCSLENQAQVAKMNAVSRETEERHQAAINLIAQQLEKANADAKTQNDKLRSAVAANGYRMRVTPSSCVSNTPDAGVASGDQPEPTAELDPAIGRALFDIAQTGDEAIRSLNACIAAYDKVRDSK